MEVRKEPAMTIEEAIRERHSIRSYEPGKKISREIQKRILNAGLMAPSPKNRQPWEFAVIDDPGLCGRIADRMEEELRRLTEYRRQKRMDTEDLRMAGASAEIIRQTPMLVFICYCRDPKAGHDDPSPWPLSAEQFEAADLQSIGAAVQNMLLEAVSLGLGSLWMCDVLYAYDVLMSLLKLEHPFIAAVAFGYRRETVDMGRKLDLKVRWVDKI